MIRCRVTTFDEALPEIEGVLDAHWQEVGSYRDHFTRCIHYEEYRMLAAAGRLLTVVASNEAGGFAGYFIGVLGRDLHRNSLAKPEERVVTLGALVYYMRPEYRGHARTLIRFVERYAVERYGAQIINIRVKTEANAADAFLTLLGYRISEVNYTRLIGEASDEKLSVD
jgi:GNAT superfamily N-acetyltransferase